MKKLLSLALSAVMLASSLASCAQVKPNSRITSSAGLESYATYLESRLGDNFPERIVLETEGDSDVDMGDFRKDGFIVRKKGNDAVIIGKSADGVDRGVRYYANYCTDVDIADYSYGEGNRVKKITIAGRDISEYSIYLFPEADECHNYAATELQKYIKLACGVELPIVREKAEHMIAFERVLEDDARYETLGDQGFTIKVDDAGNLNIIGGRWSGCMYGAFELLEYIGWRFFGNWEVVNALSMPEEDYYYLYESELVEIPSDFEDTQIPSFEYRQGRTGLPAEYLAKMKENDATRRNSKFNGYGYSRGTCHGLNGPISKGLFEDFEYNNGSIDVNPCFSREDYIGVTVEYFSDEVDKKLAAGQVIGRELVEVDIGHCDTLNFCACNECLKYVKKDGSNTGPVLYFSNRVAEALGERYPGLYVSMFAYAGTTKPPKTTVPLPNVNVSYCFYSDVLKNLCYSHGIGDDNCDHLRKDNFGFSLSNLEYRDEFIRWCEISNRVTVWYYPGQWRGEIIPFCSIKNILKDIRFFADHNIHGIYPCLELNSADIRRVLSQDYIISYIIDEVQWNAYMTEEEYWDKIEEYYYIVYGDGADSIVDYQRWLIDAEMPGCWSAMTWSFPTYRLNFDKAREDFEYCVGLFDRALDLAQNSEQYYGIELLSRGMLFTGLCATYNSWYVNGTEEQRARYTQLFERLEELILRSNTLMNHVSPELKLDITENPIYILPSLYVDKTEWINTIK